MLVDDTIRPRPERLVRAVDAPVEDLSEVEPHRARRHRGGAGSRWFLAATSATVIGLAVVVASVRGSEGNTGGVMVGRPLTETPPEIQEGRSYEMRPSEAASVAGFPIRTFDPPTGWTLVRSEFQRIALPVGDTSDTGATVGWFTQEFVPDGVDPNGRLYPALTVIQNSVQWSPLAIPPEAEQITLAGKDAFVSPPPEGVEQGGAISFWDSGGQYIINSNTLTVQELLVIVEQFASQDTPSN